MYANMKKLYLNNHPALFNMAVAHLLDIGFRNAQKITDKEIEKMPGNALMTKEYVQDLVRLTREIANECGNDIIEIIQFCQAENVFETQYYTGRYDDEDGDEYAYM